MHDAISVEDLLRPAVVLVNEGFVTDGRSAASNKGMPVVRMVPEAVPCECSVKEDAEAGVRLAMPSIMKALTEPLSAEEQGPKRKESERPAKFVLKGQLEEFNRFFYKRGWGDGLPLLPPTEQAVSDMMAGTDLPPDHIVGQLEPRRGKATVEKIAVNAVMAGALPIHMPILIACVEALADPLAALSAYGTSTGSWAPTWIINGPVRRDARVNSGTGAMSPGDIANAAIGRAMGLIIKNVGGIRKAVEDMGVFGHPAKYSCVIAENEEESPWAPLHVQDGLQKEESAVTLFFPNSYVQVWQYGSDDKGILSALMYNLPPGVGGSLSCLLLSAQHARALAQRGWTKPMIQQYFFEFARVPAYRHPSFHDGGGWTLTRTPDSLPPNPSDPLGIVRSPNHVKVLVAGGPGAFLGILSGSAGPLKDQFVSKKIRLPGNWSKLVAKYRSFVPVYEQY